MALVDAIRKGVQVAAKVTQSIQADVLHRAHQDALWTGEGADVQPVVRKGLVEDDRREIRDGDGRLVQVEHRITFLEIFPLTLDDALTLPDGSSSPIVRIEAMKDPAGGYLTPPVVLLGRRVES